MLQCLSVLTGKTPFYPFGALSPTAVSDGHSMCAILMVTLCLVLFLFLARKSIFFRSLKLNENFACKVIPSSLH